MGLPYSYIYTPLRIHALVNSSKQMEESFMIYLIQELLNHISTLQNVLIFTLLLVLEHVPQHEEQAQAHPAGAHCVGDGLEPHQPPGQLQEALSSFMTTGRRRA